jgi:hypothetical protein
MAFGGSSSSSGTGFEAVFERQREIDLRLLKEIETLKAAGAKGHGARG